MNGFDLGFVIEMLPLLLQGARMTIILTIYAIGLGTLIGLVIALAKISNNGFLNLLGSFYTWVFRGIPLLVQLFILYFALPGIGINLTPMQAAVSGLSMCGGAYIAEIIRAGIQSIDKGQMEAALSLGMNYYQAMSRVIIPQTYRRLIPPMGNEFITLMKDTALVSVVTMYELLRAAQLQATSFFKPFEMYITAGLMYLALTTIFTMVFNRLERKLAIYE